MFDLDAQPEMRPFIVRHPYEVWGGSQYHARFASLNCAARTAAEIPDGLVKAPGGDCVAHGECVRLDAELRSRMRYRGGVYAL